MKRLTLAMLCASMIGCATTVDAAAAYYGLPPGSAVVINAARDSLWGAAVKRWGKQPAATGAVSPSIGAAIESKLPTSATDAGVATLLQNAAKSLPAK